MKQYEQVIEVMKENGGFATLGFLNQNVNVSLWKTKTPFANIRRIVQNDRFFFRIKPGLWALKTFKEKLPLSILPKEGTKKETIEELNHAHYQGLLVEMGNLKEEQTFVPYQDKNKSYLNQKLQELTSIDKFYNFSYENIVKKAKTVDVSWFNKRKMPSHFFEVEHSTNIQNSLVKFTVLQDFNVEFYIVANNARKKEYDDKLSLDIFSKIKARVKFMSYDKLAQWHAQVHESTQSNNPFQ